jgi:RNA polymerase sigma-70 factor (ECF subfamily)
MKNIFINDYRKMLCQRAQPSPGCLQEFDVTPEEVCQVKEIHRLINALPRIYKIPFYLYISGFQYTEIAEKLQINMGTVKSRMFYARQKLQRELT